MALDQSTKWAAHAWLAPNSSLPVIPGIFHLTYVQNTGAAFGIFRGLPGLFILPALAISGWLILELTRRDHPPLSRLGLALMLGGAIGNLIDRVRLGHVVDFLDLRVWPVFNVADSAITIGVTVMILTQLLGRGTRDEGQANSDASRVPRPPSPL